MLLNCESENRMIRIIEKHDLVINGLCVYVINMWKTIKVLTVFIASH